MHERAQTRCRHHGDRWYVCRVPRSSVATWECGMHIFLETERLMLRRFTEDDVDNLVDLDSDPAVVWDGRSTPREEVERDHIPAYLDYYQRYEGYGFWAAIEKVTGAFLGWFHFRETDRKSTRLNSSH